MHTRTYKGISRRSETLSCHYGNRIEQFVHLRLRDAEHVSRIVNAEEDVEATKKYGVKKAPSLLVPDGDGFKAYDNASEIRKYIESIS